MSAGVVTAALYTISPKPEKRSEWKRPGSHPFVPKNNKTKNIATFWSGSFRLSTSEPRSDPLRFSNGRDQALWPLRLSIERRMGSGPFLLCHKKSKGKVQSPFICFDAFFPRFSFSLFVILFYPSTPHPSHPKIFSSQWRWSYMALVVPRNFTSASSGGQDAPS